MLPAFFCLLCHCIYSDYVTDWKFCAFSEISSKDGKAESNTEAKKKPKGKNPSGDQVEFFFTYFSTIM